MNIRREEHSGKKRWYASYWVCIILLIFFPPAGIFLLWKYHGSGHKRLKIVGTIVSALWCLVLVAAILEDKPKAIHIEAEEELVLVPGQEISLDILVDPSGSKHLVKLKSEDEDIALFDSGSSKETVQGVVRGKQEGTTYVYAYYEDILSNRVKITVNDQQLQQEREQKAAEVDKRIEMIGAVTLSSKTVIDEAKEAYDALDAKTRSLVKQEAKLREAEDTWNTLQQSVKKQAAEVDALIKKIGQVSLDSKTAIEEARKAYDLADDDTKSLIALQDDLTKAEAAYQVLVQQEQAAQQPPAYTPPANANTTPPANQQPPTAAIVYWTPSGEKYHTTQNCSTLKRSKTIYSGTIDEAKRSGKGALCKVCGH